MLQYISLSRKRTVKLLGIETRQRLLKEVFQLVFKVLD